MSNSELIDCTRETAKLRMRAIECRSGGGGGGKKGKKKKRKKKKKEGKGRRGGGGGGGEKQETDKKDHRLQARGEGQEITGGNERQRCDSEKGSDVRQMWLWSFHKL